MVCFHYLKAAFLPLLFHFILTIYRIFYWGIIALQCCLSLSCTTTWISFMYACISPSWTSLSINYVQDLIPIPSNVQCHRKTGFLKFYKEACFRAPLLSSKEHSSLFRFFMLCLLSIVSCCPTHFFLDPHFLSSVPVPPIWISFPEVSSWGKVLSWRRVLSFKSSRGPVCFSFLVHTAFWPFSVSPFLSPTAHPQP